MEVFLIPVAADRYELYCEVPDLDAADVGDEPRGFFRGLLRSFRAALADAERARHQPPAPDGHDTAPSLYERARRQVLCRMAEAIAEQRLLWHVRRQTEVTAVHPEDMTEHRALQILRGHIQSDFEKHRFWTIVDLLAFAASGVLVVLPGPNLVAYYFGFRLVGHYLSMRGARHALKTVVWHARASALLTELRATIALEPEEREARVHDIAAQLQLERLARFFLRTATPGRVV
jgi:hypothetical protein